MLFVWLVLVFLCGAVVGSFVNLCVARLPLEKSLLWPGPRCGQCYQPIRWFDCLPLISYGVLRGRCRTCGARFSPRYFLVEMVTGVAFAGLFYLDVVRNLMGLRFLAQHQHDILQGVIPWEAWLIFLHHAVLLGFLLVTSLCDLDDMEIPLTVTTTGTLVGLVGSMLFPWPFPGAPPTPPAPRIPSLSVNLPEGSTGLYPWPVWYPLPAWLPPGSWQLGLVTGLAGAAAGMLALRGIRFLFGLGRGREGLGMGDADLMMMAGSFVGWQPVVLAFFAGTFVGLFVGIARLLLRGSQALAFGPSLAVGVFVVLFSWPRLGPYFQPLFFTGWFIGGMVGVGAVLFLSVSFLVRLILGTPKEPQTPAHAAPAAKQHGETVPPQPEAVPPPH
jgi:leader peptidase (prepilin peptidase)/N-methyltransferase